MFIKFIYTVMSKMNIFIVSFLYRLAFSWLWTYFPRSNFFITREIKSAIQKKTDFVQDTLFHLTWFILKMILFVKFDPFIWMSHFAPLSPKNSWSITQWPIERSYDGWPAIHPSRFGTNIKHVRCKLYPRVGPRPLSHLSQDGSEVGSRHKKRFLHTL